MKKTALIILDGWGHGHNTAENAIYNAKTPFIDSLYKTYPNCEIKTDGVHVGLPKGQMGNSEVGHLNIGAGRIVHQDLLKINQEIKSNKIRENKIIRECIERAKKTNKPIHIMGLFSNGGIHSHIDHLKVLCEIAIENHIKHIFVHAFTDGRDSDPKGGKDVIKEFLNYTKNKNISIASVIGRYYSMDRDKRWEKTSLAYEMLVHGKGQHTQDILKEIENSYKSGITDEFILPIVNTNNDHQPIATINPADILICFNFRSDRCRQLVAALTQINIPQYNIYSINLSLYTMTKYDESFEGINVLYPKRNIKNTLGETLSKSGVNQLRIAETEKYPHVTFFFSGGQEKEFNLEKRIMIPSSKVATYNLKPEMSAREVTEACIKELKQNIPQFICLNYANPDMVGHTGDIQAVIKAIETIDHNLKKLVQNALKKDYEIIITSDHGNAEKMKNNDGTPNTAHTNNKVPLFILNNKIKKLSNGRLCDIAPTILKIMEINQPTEMTGEPLF
tara:strand:+ start:440 stop:1954 length:1515 start_codon:yes stop_codon:yes gene_type:complete